MGYKTQRRFDRSSGRTAILSRQSIVKTRKNTDPLHAAPHFGQHAYRSAHVFPARISAPVIRQGVDHETFRQHRNQNQLCDRLDRRTVLKVAPCILVSGAASAMSVSSEGVAYRRSRQVASTLGRLNPDPKGQTGTGAHWSDRTVASAWTALRCHPCLHPMLQRGW